jgi:RNA polymerase sigma-70 factor, ECF subfamily
LIDHHTLLWLSDKHEGPEFIQLVGKKNSRVEIEQGLGPLYPRLWRYCVALTGSRDRANDLAQSACARALEKSDRYEAGTRLDLWMFRLTQRLWLNEIRADTVRQSGKMVPIDDIEIPDTKMNPETNLLANEVFLKVMALPEAQRVTVILVYVDGFSYKEASAILEIPIGTVMSRLAAARAKIASEIAQKESKTA